MPAAHKAPIGYNWRPSTVVQRVVILERMRDAHIVGSVGPAKRGMWANRDSGAEFKTKAEAMADVELQIVVGHYRF